MRRYPGLGAVPLALLLWLAGAGQLDAQDPLPLGEMVTNLAMTQHRGSWFRDRCIYFQRLNMERFKSRPEEGNDPAPFYRRQSVAEVSADKNGEVIAQLVSDTDGGMKRKTVSASSRNVFGAPRFLELIFFPLYPEQVKFYEITDLGTAQQAGRALRILRLFPRQGFDTEPLVEGVFYVDPVTGAPARLTIDRLHNFQALDSHLKDLLDFRAEIEFKTLPNGVTVPGKAVATGFSKISRYDGYFRIDFEEWGYRANPLYPDVNPYFEKMNSIPDPAPPPGPEPEPPPAGGGESENKDAVPGGSHPSRVR